MNAQVQTHTPSHCLDRRRHRPRFFVLKIIGQRSQRFELNSTQSFLWDISDMANAPRLAQGNRTENMEMNGTAPAQVSLVQLVQSKGPSQTAVVSLSARSELCKIRIPSYQEASCVENKFEFRPRIRKHLAWKTIFFSDQRKPVCPWKNHLEDILTAIVLANSRLPSPCVTKAVLTHLYTKKLFKTKRAPWQWACIPTNYSTVFKRAGRMRCFFKNVKTIA